LQIEGLKIIGLLLCTELNVELLGMVKPEPCSSGRFTYIWTNALAPKIFTVGALERVKNPTALSHDARIALALAEIGVGNAPYYADYARKHKLA
jgi:hypothetical protein